MIKAITHRFKSDRKIILKLIKTFFSRGLAAVGTLTFHFILARVMGMSEYGLFVIGYVLITGASLFAKFGMTSAIIKHRCVEQAYAKSPWSQIKDTRDERFEVFIENEKLG